MKNTQYLSILTAAALMSACSNPNTPPAGETAVTPATESVAAPVVSEAEKNYLEAKRLLDANATGPELATAVNLLLKATELGSSDAHVQLAKLYREGRGLPQNQGEVINLLQLASGKGNAEAAYELGLLFETGAGVEKNAGEALNNYLRAAQAGNKDAMLKVAEAFRTGAGAPVNAEEAGKWYRKAVEAGHPDAAAKLKELEAK